MFDKTIKIEVNGEAVYLTNQQVVDLFTQRVAMQRKFDEAAQKAFLISAEKKVMKDRLDAANAKLKEFGNPGQF